MLPIARVIHANCKAASSWRGTIRGVDVCWLGFGCWYFPTSPSLTPKMTGIPIKKSPSQFRFMKHLILLKFTQFTPFLQLQAIPETFQVLQEERVSDDFLGDHPIGHLGQRSGSIHGIAVLGPSPMAYCLLKAY